MTDTVDIAAARGELEVLLAELAAADDDRWAEVVMGLVDDTAHHVAAERYNTSEGSGDDVADYEQYHGEADRTRAELHNADSGVVAGWLAENLGVLDALAELRDRLGGE